MSRMFCCLQVKPLGFLKPSSLTKVSGRFKAHQDSLPRLPVPPLQQSLDHYLKTLQPIVSEEEWAHTKQLVEEFQTAGGVGERLQKGLERRARKTENWVSENRGHPGPPVPMEGASVPHCGLLLLHTESSSTSCSGVFAGATEFLECLLCAWQ